MNLRVGFDVRTRPHCREMNDQVLRLVTEQKPDVVVMLASWSFYNGQGEFDKLDMAQVASTVTRLHDAGVLKIVVLGPLPRWLVHEPDVVLGEWDRTGTVPYRSEVKLDPKVFETETRLRAVLTGAPGQYVSLLDKLCVQSACQLTTQADGARYPMAWDDAHLSLPGSNEVARLLAPEVFGARR